MKIPDVEASNIRIARESARKLIDFVADAIFHVELAMRITKHGPTAVSMPYEERKDLTMYVSTRILKGEALDTVVKELIVAGNGNFPLDLPGR
jgi:hypothetical protein